MQLHIQVHVLWTLERMYKYDRFWILYRTVPGTGTGSWYAEYIMGVLSTVVAQAAGTVPGTPSTSSRYM